MKKMFLQTIIVVAIGTGVIATTISETITPTTQPAAMLLLGAALVGLACLSRRKKQ